ncbi:MAG TPA: DUF3667 domain-containing protein [Hyphomonadaceae bacterium]|jgi:hypothetical protein|nr:DUF3667 domain-containing protein [Hyphomonadaceae bacterium]
MSGEIEAVGAAATAGLVATAIDEPKSAKKKRGHGACANCGADLTGKRYCAECGQPAHLHHALLNMIEEFVRGLVFFDTRIWRTLGLLIFRPGTLTYNYIHGKRVRYISPISLFLLAVFAMFFVFSLIGGARLGVSDQSTQAQRTVQIELAEEQLATAEETLADLKKDGASGGAIEAAQLQVDARRKVLERFKGAPATGDKGDALPTDASVRIDTLKVSDEGSFYDEIKKAAQDGDAKSNTGFKALDDRINESLLNPELGVYKIQNAAYKFAFLLVPISLPFVWLMFMWRRGTTLFDHTVYILYSLTFVSILFIVFSLALFVFGDPGWLAAPLMLAGPVHAFFHLKGGYGLGWFSAIWRLPFQLVFSLIGLCLFLIVIFVLGLAG